MQLKIYQENAVEDLLGKAKKLLGYSGNKKLGFKAPTGSGKTIMMAEFLKRLVNDNEVRQSLTFIWTAPRQLHIQSREKLESYFENTRALKCSFFEDLDDKKIDENEVLFFNWESINKEDNIYIRDNEQDFNLSNVLERTRGEGREIILVIDEAHHHATSEISQKLINEIAPKLTVEVSATPVIQNPDETTSVQIEDVKAEGVIKKAVILNEKFKNILEAGKIKTELGGMKDSDEIVIKQALKKRDELSKAYKKEDVEINPLVLIQLPDRIGQLEDEMKNRVIGILKDKYDISVENGKLAIWLSGEHVNKEYVEKNNSEVEVLIFKQAIALGWDCPRAHILVLFRQWHSPIFSIQTVGRIMRMPEPDYGHYATDVLNYGYVFTNLNNIEIHEDIARDYITTYTSNRRDDYKPINLLAYHPRRHREKTRLASSFIKIFLEEAEMYGLKGKIDVEAKKLDLKLISDWKAEEIDTLAGTKIVGDEAITASGRETQKLFDYFVRQNLAPFYPEDRSVGRVKEAIYRFLENELKVDYGDQSGIQLVLSDKNEQHFINVIEITKKAYQESVVKREAEVVWKEDWNVPVSLTFGDKYVETKRKKSIMLPFYSDERWKTERTFINFLEKADGVEWWFKNGEREELFLAVPYNDGEQKPFYVDFVVKLKDGRIGLFDTKSGFTIWDARPKIDGLHDYLLKETKKGRKIFGGIVTNTDQMSYLGKWIYFDKTSKDLKENDLSNWENLEIHLHPRK